MEVIRINTEDFRSNIINIPLTSDFWSIVTPEGRIIDPREIFSVYLRRISPVLVDDVAQDFRKFTSNETSVVIEALPGLLPTAKWMDYPHVRKIADNKLFQLKLARSLGLSVPETLVTNDYASLLMFAAGRRIIYKTLYIPILDLDDRGVSVINTTLLTDQYMKQLEVSLRLCPSLFQVYIEKEYELRIHIVGNDILAVSIDSQSVSGAEIDWRTADFDALPYEPVKLPTYVYDKIVSFTRSLGLNFGIIDMIVTPDGQYVFLEINPNGNWLWIERAIGLDVSGRIARWLS
ncbi:ATP-dependent carboxylate-amine ligase [Candidatus Parcubacteria bacterium]|nr:MAG: ATP-dependent carboxylate-amine ligase [Candidatus Parcubacteria bacterium]